MSTVLHDVPSKALFRTGVPPAAGAVVGVSFTRDRRYVRCQYAPDGEEGATATVAVLLGQPAKIM